MKRHNFASAIQLTSWQGWNQWTWPVYNALGEPRPVPLAPTQIGTESKPSFEPVDILRIVAHKPSAVSQCPYELVCWSRVLDVFSDALAERRDERIKN